MFRLSKKIEYAILALRYLSLNSRNENGCISVKEISDKENIPYELLAKILQKLSKTDLLISHKGTNGGYLLGVPSSKISISDIIQAVDEEIQITDCMKENGSKADCERFDCCSIREPLVLIQNKVKNVFTQTKVSDLV